jgi:hypothetical protein
LKNGLVTGYGKTLELVKTFKIVVARDGVEPPTPAFSEFK